MCALVGQQHVSERCCRNPHCPNSINTADTRILGYKGEQGEMQYWQNTAPAYFIRRSRTLVWTRWAWLKMCDRSVSNSVARSWRCICERISKDTVGWAVCLFARVPHACGRRQPWAYVHGEALIIFAVVTGLRQCTIQRPQLRCGPLLEPHKNDTAEARER